MSTKDTSIWDKTTSQNASMLLEQHSRWEHDALKHCLGRQLTKFWNRACVCSKNNLVLIQLRAERPREREEHGR